MAGPDTEVPRQVGSAGLTGEGIWHRGLSILDIAVAHLILERAVAADTGIMLRYH
jgi:hypothetical protein